MARAYCGLDFGTSNSTAGIAAADGIRLVPLEGDVPTLPSAIFFDFADGGVLYGRAAVDAYVERGDGRLLRSVKSVLATDLIEQDTALKDRRIAFQDVIALLLGHVKAQAERSAGHPVEAVVHGRPVHFVDGDPAADARAQAALEVIARRVGFSEVSFQFEPIAAALHYEAQVEREEIALIADIGGGTSDVSVVRIGPDRAVRAERAGDVLGNDGIRIGGTDFDRQLSLEAIMPLLGYGSAMVRPGLAAPRGYFQDLATWSKINFLYVPRVLAEIRQVRREAKQPELFDRLLTVLEHNLGHALAMRAEGGKIMLSDWPSGEIDLDIVEPGLAAPVDRALMARAIAEPVDRITSLVRGCLGQAGVPPERVAAVFLTGGSTLLPAVRRAIVGIVPEARVVEGDKFGAVGLGLTLEARRRYG
ncbi:Hsp70 family protein [Arenibaculum pallidiluteum]|uniref:Hsp70 family protein n=1 Tax=Arenibaculum pallidiluteum TaxID=2812559 RepID=UPI001A976DB9|nr:Hsp70 family protein [Arenibaculum pallidiluteum]